MRWSVKQSRSGVILISALWMLVILSFSAVSLSRHGRIQTALTKYFLTKTRLAFTTWAAVTVAFEKIEEDSKDEKSKLIDTLAACGIKPVEADDEDEADEKEKTLKEIFGNIAVGEGTFSIVPSGPDFLGEQEPTVWGFSDEERKINLNSLTRENSAIFRQLLQLMDVDEETAEDLALYVVDWIDKDETFSIDAKEKEDDYYMNIKKPYHCKNRPFDSVEELLLVRGMELKIFDKIKDYLTVFPKQAANATINIYTASPVVLSALARSVSGPQTNTNEEEADKLAEKIVQYRRGPDEKEQTSDDPQELKDQDMRLSTTERIIYQAMSAKSTPVSNYLRVGIRGAVKGQKVGSRVEMVISRDQLRIEDWRQY